MGRTEYSKLVEYGEFPQPPVKKTSTTSVLRKLFYALLILVACIALIATIGGTWAFFWFKHQVKRFTVTTPLDLPVVDMSEDELIVAKDRAVLFVDSLKAGLVPDPPQLVVTTKELNGFFGHSDFFRGNAYVTMTESEESTVSLDLSLPARHLPGGKGRYFVANGFVNISNAASANALVQTSLDTLTKIDGLNDPLFLADLLVSEDKNTHQVSVLLQKGEVLGHYAPQEYIDEKVNLLDDIFQDCPENKRIVEGIESVTIRDGEIVIQARTKRRPSVQAEEEGYYQEGKPSSSWKSDGARALLRKLL